MTTKCLSPGKQKNKLWQFNGIPIPWLKYKLLIYTTSYIHFKRIMLSERKSTQKATFYRPSFIWYLEKAKLIERREISSCQRLGVREDDYLKRTPGNFWRWWKCPMSWLRWLIWLYTLSRSSSNRTPQKHEFYWVWILPQQT